MKFEQFVSQTGLRFFPREDASDNAKQAKQVRSSSTQATRPFFMKTNKRNKLIRKLYGGSSKGKEKKSTFEPAAAGGGASRA